MSPKDILKEAFDSDIKVLEKAYQGDMEILEIINTTMNAYISTIWTALIERGIVTKEQWQEYIKISKDLLEKEGK
jgi:hypothetical protein